MNAYPAHFSIEPFAFVGESEEEFDGEFSSQEWEEEANRRRQRPRRSTRPRAGERVRRRPRPWLVRTPGASEYVRWLQSSLNQIMDVSLLVDGIMAPAVRNALRSFQKRQGLPADGIVGPDTERALLAARGGQPSAKRASQPAEPEPPETEYGWPAWESWEDEAPPNGSGALGTASAPYIPGGWPAPPAGRKELSGAIWVSRFPTSRSTSDLEPTFANNVNRFISALKAAGASVSIAATYRPPERAYLMHWAWKIANGVVSAQNVPPMPGVEINWWHGNDADSRRAAQEMVVAYKIVSKVSPSLTSRHIERRAIDMSIFWSGNLQIKKANGQPVLISSSPKDGTNPSLIEVGHSYNVVHFQPSEDDPPHWSVDGR